MTRAVLIILFLSLLLGKVWAGPKPLIVASIYPLAEIAKEIGGEAVEVRLLLPPGADPHAWEPTPQDILSLKKAALLFAVGGGLEPWLDDLRKGLKIRHLFLIFPLKTSYSGHGPDPHVWLDFPRDAEISWALAQKMAQIIPDKAHLFLTKGKKLQEKFLKLHHLFQEALATCRYRTVVLAGHDAFGAWEKNYGVRFFTLAGQSPEAEPTPKTLQRLVELVKQKGLKAVYYDEPSARRFAEIIAEETGAKVYYLTPAASPTREELAAGLSFWNFMFRNLKYLSLGLCCRLNIGQI